MSKRFSREWRGAIAWVVAYACIWVAGMFLIIASGRRGLGLVMSSAVVLNELGKYTAMRCCEWARGDL